MKFGEYWEISEKDLLKFCQKLEKSSKNFTVKIKLLFIAKDLQYKIHLFSMSYDSNTLELQKKSLSAVVMQILKGFSNCFYQLYIQVSEVGTWSLQR